MTHKEFKKVLEEQIKRVYSVMDNKSVEYASDTNKLANFHQAAPLLGISVPQTIASFMAKHTVSIYDMVRSGKPYSMETWDEKITDHINYLILLRAAISENTELPHAET
jgi:hypothetical protein